MSDHSDSELKPDNQTENMTKKEVHSMIVERVYVKSINFHDTTDLAFQEEPDIKKQLYFCFHNIGHQSIIYCSSSMLYFRTT